MVNNLEIPDEQTIIDQVNKGSEHYAVVEMILDAYNHKHLDEKNIYQFICGKDPNNGNPIIYAFENTYDYDHEVGTPKKGVHRFSVDDNALCHMDFPNMSKPETSKEKFIKGSIEKFNKHILVLNSNEHIEYIEKKEISNIENGKRYIFKKFDNTMRFSLDMIKEQTTYWDDIMKNLDSPKDGDHNLRFIMNQFC